ncbi:MAG: ABC transporter ATP-binding protein [Firmicutes bacterium]|jgi:branched-chain amino acid transport system ATP-binding protein|nr:ABC transporter ATP-binding protein [Bacillota bacterium]
MLVIEALTGGYESSEVFRNVNLEVPDGAFVSLIGPNGAGKTTLLKTIVGLLRSRRGRVVFDGADITNLPPEQVIVRGLTLVPEGRKIFYDLTVRENILVGAYLRKDTAGIKQDLERMTSLFPVLGQRLAQLGGTLSGGEQGMLALARALMSRPKMLMLDEPSLGLGPIIVDQVMNTLKEINQRGTTIFLVEQNAEIALQASDRVYVLDAGEVAASGTPDELLGNAALRSAYLGTGLSNGSNN